MIFILLQRGGKCPNQEDKLSLGYKSLLQRQHIDSVGTSSSEG